MKRSRILVPALAAGLALALASPGSAADPKIVKACGSTAAAGLTLEVDIAEGRLPTTCAQARRVIRRFVDSIGGGSDDVDGCCNRKVKLGAKRWSCYKSREDGLGWEYNCNRFLNRPGPLNKTYVNVGGGRRF